MIPNFKKYHVFCFRKEYIIGTDDIVAAQQYAAIYNGFIKSAEDMLSEWRIVSAHCNK